MQIIFFGTPEFAVPSLQQLISHPAINVLAVVTQPDKPIGRKQKLTAPPVKTVATEHCIPVYQPDSLSKDENLLEKLKSYMADVFITAAYGQILRQTVLDIPKLGVINLHASLLPAYRGPAPINWMLINGEEEIGISTMFSDSGVDTGPVIDTMTMIPDANEDSADLTQRMSIVGSDLLLESLLKIDDALKVLEDNDYAKVKEQFGKPQQGYDGLHVSRKLAPFMTKDLGKIDFTEAEIYYSSPNHRQAFFSYSKPNTAKNIHNMVRGTFPWPCTFTLIQGEKVAIIETQLIEDDTEINNGNSLKPGAILRTDNKNGYIFIQTQDGILQINRLKPAGKKEMKASDCLNGFRLKEGDSLV